MYAPSDRLSADFNYLCLLDPARPLASLRKRGVGPSIGNVNREFWEAKRAGSEEEGKDVGRSDGGKEVARPDVFRERLG